MRPRSFSASALSTAGLCMARYYAENIQYARGESNVAALEGTAVHGALEMYVKRVYIERAEPPSLETLLAYYDMSYIATFGSSDFKNDEHKSGVKMLKNWFAREDFSDFEVLTCEVKENFPIPVKIGGVKEEIPFNYIWDRHDKIGEGIYRVVDYKSNRMGLSPDELRNKLQARCYGLACQIKHPDAKQVWVEFDMLRHSGRVGTVFTREDNIETWRFLKAEAQRIIDTDESKPLPETINPDCGFCVRKASCKALNKNIAVGGVFSLDPAKRVDRRADLFNQKRAIEAALKEIDSVILAEAKESDQGEIEGERFKQVITVRSTRYVDPDMAFQVIGPELARKYGGSKITMGAVDALLEGDELSDEQKSQLRGLITKSTGNPYVTTKALPVI